MRRIYWDTMLLIDLLEGNVRYKDRVEYLLRQSYRRHDRLFTSFVGLGEVMAGAGRSSAGATVGQIRAAVDRIGFTYLPFGAEHVEPFSLLRSVHRVKTADAIHLACAAAEGVDLFLSRDVHLLKLEVPGIKFIASMDTELL